MYAHKIGNICDTKRLGYLQKPGAFYITSLRTSSDPLMSKGVTTPSRLLTSLLSYEHRLNQEAFAQF